MREESCQNTAIGASIFLIFFKHFDFDFDDFALFLDLFYCLNLA